MTSDSRFQCNHREVAARVLDGEAVLINLATGVYYSSDGAGARAWELLDAGCSLEETAGHLAHSYRVEPDRVRSDLDGFCQELVSQSLLLPRETPPTPLPALDRPDAPYVPPRLNAFHDMGDLLAVDPPGPDLNLLP